LPNVGECTASAMCFREIGPSWGFGPFPAESSSRRRRTACGSSTIRPVWAARAPARVRSGRFCAAARSGLAAAPRRPASRRRKSAKCFALDADEARAEKVRAALTREAARDFYDSTAPRERRRLSSSAFIELVDANSPSSARPHGEAGEVVALTEKRRRQVEAGLARDLPAVLRTDAPQFDLDTMLAQFDQLWRRVILK